MVQPHYVNPNRAMPNDSINYRNFWSGNKNWEKLPYYRGCLYAFYLDNQLRATTNGRVNLDAVMLDILQKIRANPLQKLDHPFFKSVIEPHVGKKGIADFEQFIERGVPIRFKKTPLPEGIEYDQKDITFSSGPSKEVVTKREKFKDIPVFLRKKAISDEVLKAAILK
jgi:predicted metalloprotease with PDZ domain